MADEVFQARLVAEIVRQVVKGTRDVACVNTQTTVDDRETCAAQPGGTGLTIARVFVGLQTDARFKANAIVRFRIAVDVQTKPRDQDCGFGVDARCRCTADSADRTGAIFLVADTETGKSAEVYFGGSNPAVAIRAVDAKRMCFMGISIKR